ncbi:hypothetical protein [Tautonia plasticadhaerens]|uniref:Uncharacterized protein n=1 Tax=Tautonia plasticadhaerens TaxID=2527974 RepID=A0A518HEG3_9BACT|nr:hypothetical protein [Tautonia plasticadhaerens]QDV39224.1 hypothetical protein ElP_71880 [Tautonia plasticadhaerens]
MGYEPTTVSDTTRDSCIKDLLVKAGEHLDGLHAARVWMLYPLGCQGSSDQKDVYREVPMLGEVADAIGRRLLDGSQPGIKARTDAETLRAVGHVLIKDYFSERIREHDRVRSLWRSGDWESLHVEGLLPYESDYEELMTEFPVGHPDHITRVAYCPSETGCEDDKPFPFR